MKEKLIQYVNLLFAGTDNSDEIRDEILQNTLDRYEDLLEQGKSPEAAYRLAITGIGDINEILGGSTMPLQPAPQPVTEETSEQARKRKIVTGIAIGMYICCPLPLVVLQNTLGLCLLLLIVAAATVLLVVYGKEDKDEDDADSDSPQSPLKKNVGNVISTLGLVVYFVVSFYTGAWGITWVIFPLLAAIKGLVNACIDLKEENR